MGYTNYWERPPLLPAPAFGQAVADCRRILPELHIPLAGADGSGKPIFRTTEIVFNGVGAASYETFGVRREEADSGDSPRGFSFCKTAHKPYDLAVQVALIVFKHHLGAQLCVRSDGKEAAWDRARQLCQQYLGYGTDFRLDPG
ncbi:MAG: hypothetical protein WCI73_05220 [Phycisphaerae bacterium]